MWTRSMIRTSRSRLPGDLGGDAPSELNRTLILILADMLGAALWRDDAVAASKVESTGKATIDRES